MKGQAKAYIALIFICIVWGTTYLAIRIGVMHYPAFLFAGIRQLAAGIILGVAALLINKSRDLSLRNILKQMLVGFLMLSVGNGCVTYGEKFVSSGIAALLCGLMPIFAVIFNMLFSKKEHFNVYIIVGLVLGFLGVALIFRNNIADFGNKEYIGGIFCVILATSSWATGSIVNRKYQSPVNPIFNSAMQLFFGGVFMLIASPVLDGGRPFQVWQPQALLALAYLIIFGSVLAYAAYMYALSKLPVGIATIYAYINPLVAVLLGYFLLKEPLTIYTALSFITIITGVYLVNKGYKKQHAISDAKILKDSTLAVGVVSES